MSESRLDALARLGLDYPDFRISPMNFRFDPLPRIRIAMSEDHCPRRNAVDEGNQLVAIRVCRQVEVLELAIPNQFTRRSAKEKRNSRLSGFETSPGRIRIGIADEKDRLPFVGRHSHGHVMSCSVFAHHAGREYKNASATQLHRICLVFVENHEVESFSQAQTRMLTGSAMRFEIVDFREDTPQASNI